MRSRRSLGMAMTLGVLAWLASASAVANPRATVSSHRVHLTGTVGALSSTGKVGVAGTKDHDAGILTGTVAGSPKWNGALTQVATWGPDLTIRSTGTAFSDNGTLDFTLHGRFTPRSPGVLALSGKLVVTRGTGTYAHVRGTLALSGAVVTGSVNPDEITFTLTGSVAYPHRSG
jgi:hypothetical protein